MEALPPQSVDGVHVTLDSSGLLSVTCYLLFPPACTVKSMQDANLDPAPAPARTRVWGLRDIAIVTVAVLLLFLFVPPRFTYPPKPSGERTQRAPTSRLPSPTCSGTSR